MDFLSELWLPVVVSAIFLWIVSSIIHMVFPHHKNEWKRLPEESRLLETLSGCAPDQYMFPYCEMADMNKPEVQEKIKKGPNGILTIWPGPTNMSRNLILTFLFYIAVGIFIAFLGWNSLGKGAEYMTVFRFVGVAAFMAYGLGWIPGMIWFGGKGFWTSLSDSIVYALVTAGTFGWLWPR